MCKFTKNSRRVGLTDFKIHLLEKNNKQEKGQENFFTRIKGKEGTERWEMWPTH